jgi:hypothetical protein
MSKIDSTVAIQQETTQLHASICAMMNCFINGHHCPKLAQMIIQQLGHLLAQPELVPSSLAIYQQLQEHWQNIRGLLLEQQSNRRQRHNL